MKTANFPFQQFGFTLLKAGCIWLPAAGWAQEKGASKLLPGSRQWQGRLVTTPEDVAALKEGDRVTMACSKCKTVSVTHVNTDKSHIKTTTVGQKHLCPGCDSRLVTEGYGHQAKTKLAHTCKECGNEDSFGCATRNGEGPTKGMEHN